MIRAAAVLLLFSSACTVPSFEQLYCDGDQESLTVEAIVGGAADAVIGTSGCQGVKVTVSYTGFLPECVRVTARKGDGGQGAAVLPAQNVTARGERGVGGSLVVAVIAPGNWTSLTVEAQAFEKACETSKLVVTQTTPVTLTRGQPVDAALSLSATDGDRDGYVSTGTGGTDCRDNEANIHPGISERCNGVDEDCDSQSDQQEFQLGQECTAGSNCTGRRECDTDGGVVCVADTPNVTSAYPDTDGDTHGDQNAPAETFCGAVPQTHSVRNDDCDDTRANVYAGAAELCDDRDNDCDGTSNEGFPNLNQPCTIAATQCAGQFRCTQSADATTCVPSQQATTWYRDEDGDGHGRNDVTRQSCPQPTGGFVAQGGDCNESNPFIRPGATELCDGLDNNCDGQTDGPGVCPAGGASWAERTVGPGGAGDHWYSVSTWVRGGVWAVGGNNQRAVLTPSNTSFTVTNSTGNSCGANSTGWNTVWADPQSGRAYFGSAGGRLAFQETNQTACTQTTVLNGVSVYGLVGIQNGGPLEFFGATSNTTAEEGAAFYTNSLASVTFNSPNNDLAFTNDVHGSSRNNAFVVGGYDGTTASARSPRIYRFNPNDAQNDQWDSMLPAGTPGDQLKAVWVAADDVAFAVGNAGTVFRWNGTQWSSLPFPDSNAFLSSVVAFNAYTAYATANTPTGLGRIYRYNGLGWQVVYEQAGVRLNDIAGTSPEDLWVVGNGGRIMHWPQWPQ
jgi:hypothetical protein